MIGVESSELTTPNFCEDCPALPVCDINNLIVLRAGQREHVQIDNCSMMTEKMRSQHFVVACDKDSVSPEAVLLGAGEFHDATSIAQHAIVKINTCDSPQEDVRYRFLRDKKIKICGAGAVRFSERWRNPLYEMFAEDLKPGELTDPSWVNVLYPLELRDKLLEDVKRSITQSHSSSAEAEVELFTRALKANIADRWATNLDRTLLFRGISSADRYLAEQRAVQDKP
jgi:hypothetical protein